MSRADLPRYVDCSWDPLRRVWVVIVPPEHIERQGIVVTTWEGDIGPQHGRNVISGARAAEAVGKQMAALLARPGSAHNDIRRRIAKNNRRRFGP